MATATPEKKSVSLEAAKAALRAQLEAVFDDSSADVILAAASRKGRQALTAVIQPPKETLSIDARNQMAETRMRARSFERLKEDCSLLEASDVAEILGVTKQALSKKMKAGHIVAYTNARRTYFPEFQFTNSTVKPEIKKIIESVGISPNDKSRINLLIKFLVVKMDFSNIDEPSNIQPRYAFIENPVAFDIIVRDFKNRLEPGK